MFMEFTLSGARPPGPRHVTDAKASAPRDQRDSPRLYFIFFPPPEKEKPVRGALSRHVPRCQVTKGTPAGPSPPPTTPVGHPARGHPGAAGAPAGGTGHPQRTVVSASDPLYPHEVNAILSSVTRITKPTHAAESLAQSDASPAGGAGLVAGPPPGAR